MKITMFYQPFCPYCRAAQRVIEKLQREHPEYAEIEIERINELTNQQTVKDYDYWYVPTFFSGKEKLYEASPGDTPEKMEEILDGIFKKSVL